MRAPSGSKARSWIILIVSLSLLALQAHFAFASSTPTSDDGGRRSIVDTSSGSDDASKSRPSGTQVRDLAGGGSGASSTAASEVVVAGDPVRVSFTLEGCRGTFGGSFPVTGPFICPDGQYTPGDLGKGWNELDLVPHRLTTKVGKQEDATTTYKVNIVADYKKSGIPGYDFISVPVVNDPKSHDSCQVDASAQAIGPKVGEADTSIYRTLTISQDKGKTCVFDYYERLALGSHDFPGSALHSSLTKTDFSDPGGVGSRDVPLPVSEIKPQELGKTMTASQGAGFVWDIDKSATPGSLRFGDTCDAQHRTSKPVSVTVSWTKTQLPSGNILIHTEITATNPAHRPIDVTVTDTIYKGTGQTTALDQELFPKTSVPAGGSVTFDHDIQVASGTDTQFNDVAQATYTDPVDGTTSIPGNTEATASATVQTVPSDANDTVTITDTEVISGADLSFAVTSVTGASGTFSGGYTLGTKTKDPVTWTSVQSASGSVTFGMRVYVDQPTITSGSLDDTAQVIGDGETVLDSATASVAVAAEAQVSLTIQKTIPDVLRGQETQDFVFDIAGPDGYSNQVTLHFEAGDTFQSAIVDGLAPGTYTVTEEHADGWADQDPQVVDINLPDCTGTASFTNRAGGATAAVQKVTVPAGGEAGWEFTLVGPGTPEGGETATTDENGNAAFTTELQDGGQYTITETARSGWDLTGVDQDGQQVESCTFTVDLPADAGKVFACTFTNTQRGSIEIVKDAQPDDPQDFTFDGDLGSFTLDDDGEEGSETPSSQTFGDLEPGTYTVTEDAVAGWSLAGIDCGEADVTVGDNGVAIDLGPGEHVSCTFTNARQPGSITIVKDAQPDDPQDFHFTGPGEGGFTLDDDGVEGSSTPSSELFPDLEPGTYTVTEEAVAGWNLTGITCNATGERTTWSAEGATVSIDLAAGDSIVCTFTNAKQAPPPPTAPAPLGIQIVKDGPAMAHVGDTITYTFAVSLTPGSVDLHNIVLSDPICDAGTAKVTSMGDGDEWLESGETWNFTCTHLIAASDPDPLPNTATVTGTDSQGRQTSDTDDHVVDIIHPAIKIVKTADPTSGQPGDEITYTFVVTNVGDVTLYDISVDDDVLGHIGDIASLDPGQSATLTATFVLPDVRDLGRLGPALPDQAAPVRNVAVAKGHDVLGKFVQDQDNAVVTVVLPLEVTPPPPLAFTGSGLIIPLAALVMILLILGSGLLHLGRRRGAG